MRWAYADLSGSRCWYCERVWCTICHKYNGVEDFRMQARTKIQILADFKQRRAKFLDDRKKGQ
eukprot:5497377-Pyramimonas_sp.AAC.1